MELNIEALVRQQIEEIDFHQLVRQEIRELISKTVKSDIEKATKEEVKAIIKEEIVLAMKGPVKTDDGWGKKETFESFDDMFKAYFKQCMDSKWEIKEVIARHVKDETSKLVDQKTKEIVDALKVKLVG